MAVGFQIGRSSNSGRVILPIKLAPMIMETYKQKT